MDINIYQGQVTQNLRDGYAVSSETNMFPIWTSPLIATQNQETMPIKLGVRCSPNCQTSGDTLIKLIGDTANKWALALDSNGNPGQWLNYGETLTITNVIDDTNKIFWLKAKAIQGELTMLDRRVNLRIETNLKI